MYACMYECMSVCACLYACIYEMYPATIVKLDSKVVRALA